MEDGTHAQLASAYARNFQKPDAAQKLSAEGLTFWVKDQDARKKYVAAFQRSSIEAMLNYYKADGAMISTCLMVLKL